MSGLGFGSCNTEPRVFLELEFAMEGKRIRVQRGKERGFKLPGTYLLTYLLGVNSQYTLFK